MPRKKMPNLEMKYLSPRLGQRLAGMLRAPITYVEAPSGYGKTTAVHEMLFSRLPQQQVIWFTVLEDEDLWAGWQRFCQLLSRVDRAASGRLMALGEPSPKTLGAIAEILHGLGGDEESYIVIDNFQYWAGQFPGNFAMLWEQMPGERLHVVLVSQPLEGSVRQLASRAVHFVGQEWFALTEDEVADYFARVGLALPRAEVAAVWQKTEGWMAAVYLQLLHAAEGTGSGASAHDLFRLMREFVWLHLDTHAQQILLKLSLFQSFTLPQVQHLLQADYLPQDLPQVLSCRGFVRYNAQEKRYYFHALLLEMLRELHDQQSEDFRRQAWLQAGLWSEKVGNKLMAVACYHAAGEYRRLFAVALTDVELHSAGELCSAEMIEDILLQCPEDVKRDYPLNLLAFCYELFAAGHYESYMRLCGEIEAMIPGLPLPGEEKNKLLGELALMQSFAVYNDIEKMGACHQQAYALIKGRSRLVNRAVPWTMGCPSVLYMYHREAGRLAEELAHMEACLPAYTQLADGHGSGGAQMMAAERLLYQGRVEGAREKCLQGEYLARRFGQSSLLLCEAYVQARLAMLSGDKAALSTALQRLEADTESALPSLEFAADMALGHLWCLLGRPEKLVAWLKAGSFDEGLLPLPAIPFAQMVHLQYCLAVKDYARLYALAELFMADAQTAGNLIPQIYGGVFLGCAYYRSGGMQQAQKHLAQALALALPDGLLLPFAEYGEEVLPLLAGMAGAPSKADTAAIQGMAASLQQARKKQQPYSGTGTAFSLTAREHEIALLAAMRRSNQEIAEATGTSVATVRTHLQAVYSKLGIDSTLKSKRNLLESKLSEHGLISYR
ncbi:MAG: hypothetical protein GXY32_00330 [Ruminococcaceae bacterium]|nr:hypothetical protein [Oscillospiraceae bacterium]